MGNVIDLKGRTFGRWRVIQCVGRTKSGGALWECECECGNIRNVDGHSLRSGVSKSCGCLGAEHRIEASKKVVTKHGGRNERLYSVWQGIKERCFNKNNRNYAQYGGRGISMCKEWEDYSVFRAWAIENGYDKDAPYSKCTLDRIDNNLGYNPENCRWVTSMEQCNNRSSNHLVTFNGEKHTISEWARITGIRKDTLRRRIMCYGWDIERALTEPVHNR